MLQPNDHLLNGLFIIKFYMIDKYASSYIPTPQVP